MTDNIENMDVDQAVPNIKPHSDVVFTDEDIAYEEDILRNEFNLRSWQRYIDHKHRTKASSKSIRLLYERALKIFNRSFKLWYAYLKYRRKIIQHKPPTDAVWGHLCDAYERCLIFLDKMPRIWIDYCDIMVRRGLITETRRVFDRALRSLPITQHYRIWPDYVKFVQSHNIPETAIRVFRRYLKVAPEAREDFVEYLIGIDQLDEAANQLAILVNEDAKASPHGKTTYQLWMDLCTLISKNPNKIHTLQPDPIIRQGIQRYTDQVGMLWLALAEYYTRIPNFERARVIYEEALGSVTTVRDFSQIFDAYSKFAERLTSTKMNALAKAKPSQVADLELELELYLQRYEDLIFRRPRLLNAVLLRQNPNNVLEWLNRVELFADAPESQVEIFQTAVATVDVKQQVGKISDLWIAFAKFYEKRDELTEAKKIFEKAITIRYIKVDDLAHVWCEYAEFVLLHETYEAAVALLRKAVTAPAKRTDFFDENADVQQRVYKSLRLWSLYADIEEAFGTVESCKAVYDKIIDLRIANPQIVVNYAFFLEDNDRFEDSFKAYEKGIGLFRWPQVFEIWSIYLVKFVNRYKGKKLERARDLFEQCLEKCPPNLAKDIYFLYGKLEEDYGMSSQAMKIYAKAVDAVDKDHMHLVYNVYLQRAERLYGKTRTRAIFLDAIEKLPEDRSREMSLKYAKLERSLGEIDRARAIYAHCAEICDPRVHGPFWETWKDFEMAHGNEDTLREMLRVKRSVQATYNTNVNYMSAQMLASIGGETQLAGELSAADSLAQLEARAQAIASDEAATKKLAMGGDTRITFVRGESKTTQENVAENPDEIDVGGDDEDEDDEGE